MKCHKEIPCVAILNKQKCDYFFLSFAKSESRREEEVLSRGRGEEVEKWYRRVNMVPILYTHEGKRKKDSCCNYFPNGDG
jgi:hypothetical protein